MFSNVLWLKREKLFGVKREAFENVLVLLKIITNRGIPTCCRGVSNFFSMNNRSSAHCYGVSNFVWFLLVIVLRWSIEKPSGPYLGLIVMSHWYALAWIRIWDISVILPLSLFRMENRVCLSHVVQVTGAAWRATTVDVSYATPHVNEIVNVVLHREYSSGIVFIFSQVRKDLYHV
jgi:hypothetical protein